MKKFFKNHSLNMSIGLIPVIICMICCIFFPDRPVLYIGSLGSIIYVLYRQIKPPFIQPNLVLFNATLALLITSVTNGIGGNWLIPDNTASITLEILILSLSLLYFLAPHSYKKFFSYFHFKISAVNGISFKVITVFCGMHLFIFCLLSLFFNPLSQSTLYILEQILPPLLYIVCIVVNTSIVNSICINYENANRPLVRIVPVCNGKIYLVPSTNKRKRMDTPMESYMEMYQKDANRHVKTMLAEDYSENITGTPEPRFSLKYLMNLPNSKLTVLLYILPLRDESEIHFPGGKFVTPDEIKNNLDQYSTSVNEEIDHLSMAAQMWKKYQ